MNENYSMFQSLKKEMDWDRSDDKSIGESMGDYRHAHDSVSEIFQTIFVFQVVFN